MTSITIVAIHRILPPAIIAVTVAVIAIPWSPSISIVWPVAVAIEIQIEIHSRGIAIWIVAVIGIVIVSIWCRIAAIWTTTISIPTIGARWTLGFRLTGHPGD
jgi:hypothetical protein